MSDYEMFDKLKEYICNSDLIYIDACSLRKKGFPKFYKNVKNILEKNNKKIIIPEKVCNEIEKYRISGNKEAIRADKYIKKLLHHNLAIVKKAEDYELSHADHGICADFDKYYGKNRMLLISNDFDLSHDVLSINNRKSTKSKHVIQAVKITKEGYLVIHGVNEKKRQNGFSLNKKGGDLKNKYNLNDFLHKAIYGYTTDYKRVIDSIYA